MKACSGSGIRLSNLNIPFVPVTSTFEKEGMDDGTAQLPSTKAIAPLANSMSTIAKSGAERLDRNEPVTA